MLFFSKIIFIRWGKYKYFYNLADKKGKTKALSG